MTWITPTILFVFAWVLIFSQTQFRVLQDLLGSPVGLFPALCVYAALSQSLAVATLFVVVGSLWLDSLSTVRLGVSLVPFYAVAWMIFTRRQVILRDQAYAQFWLGLASGATVPLGSFMILRMGDKQPYMGWSSLWHLAISAVINGLFCPLFFRLFDGIRSNFEYQVVADPPFRPDREIEYGRSRS